MATEPASPCEAVCAVGAILIVFVVVPVGLVLGTNALARKAEQKQAIAAGVGRWVIDPVTGKQQFIYGVQAAPERE